MLEPSDITKQSVSAANFPKRLEAAVQEFQHNYLTGEAHELYLALNRVLGDQTLERADDIKRAIHDDFIVLMFLAFPLIDEPLALQLLEKHLLIPLRRGIIIEELIGRRLDLYYDTELDSVQTRKIIEAMSRNAQLVTVTEAAPHAARQRVSEWIKKLLSTHSSPKAISTLEVIQFLEAQSELKSDAELKDLVRRLLLLFARVQSVFITGILDTLFMPLREEYALEDAEEQPRPDLTAPAGDAGRGSIILLKNRFSAYLRSRGPVLAEADRMLAETRGDVTQIKRELASASRNRQSDKLMAALILLARERALVQALAASPAWKKAVAEYLSGAYRDQIPESERPALERFVVEHPDDPAIVSEFLQLLLQEKVNLTDEDSALVGVEIGQLLGGTYEHMAYGNQETGKFEWAAYRVENGQLVATED